MSSQEGQTKTIVFAAHKGGSGKTTSCVAVGTELANMGYQVLVIDLDPQANASTHIGHVHPSEIEVSSNQLLLGSGVEVIQKAIQPSKFEKVSLIYGTLPNNGQELDVMLAFNAPRPNEVLREKIKLLEGVFDVILIDTPPSLGARTKNALSSATHVVVPVEASDAYATYGISGLMSVIQDMKLLNPNLEMVGALLNRYDQRKGMCQIVRNQMETLIGSVIPFTVGDSTKVTQAAAMGQSIRQLARTNKATLDYHDITKYLIERCGIQKFAADEVV